LFDIDGTLLHSGGAGLRALYRAVSQRFGVTAVVDGIKPHGMTDPLILKDIFARSGIEVSDVAAEIVALVPEYARLLAEELQQGSGARLYPGVQELLRALSMRSKLRLGLLTGNFEQTAWIKLGHFDLARYFSFGAFGSDHEDRDLLLPIALERVTTLAGEQVTASQVAVVGDTPRDVQCAKVNGAVAVGVATSIYSVEDLQRAGADCVLDSFADTDAGLAQLLSASSRVPASSG